MIFKFERWTKNVFQAEKSRKGHTIQREPHASKQWIGFWSWQEFCFGWSIGCVYLLGGALCYIGVYIWQFVQENLSHSTYCKFKMLNRELDASTCWKIKFRYLRAEHLWGDFQELIQKVLQFYWPTKHLLAISGDNAIFLFLLFKSSVRPFNGIHAQSHREKYISSILFVPSFFRPHRG